MSRRARSLFPSRLVLATGLLAALPVIVSTIHAVSAGWLPLGDDAIIAVRSYDVLSTHPPLLGSYSASSQVIGHPVLSPGPMLFWLLAIPVRLGELAPAVAMGVVNTAAVVGVVGLARRRGGNALMFATAIAVALMCGSLDAEVFHDVWGPSATVLPFTLLIFLAWSLACGEYRLLPVTALVASFTVQTHLTYVLPALALLAVAVAFLARTRPTIPRRWVVATLAVVAVCWSLPLAEEGVHRPGNVERIVQAATAGGPTLGAAAGWHGVVHAIGLPPWWLRSPRTPFDRIAEVTYAPRDFSTATAALMLVALVAVAVVALRSRRRELAAAALMALGLMAALAVVTASTPTSHGLFGVVSYTLWWASPAGMFAWLVLAVAAVAFVRERRMVRAAAGRLRPSAALASAAGLVGVAAAGGLVGGAGEPARLEHAFGPARAIVDRVRADTPRGATVSITGTETETAFDLQGAVAYALRTAGIRFVVSSLPGIGTRYDPAKHAHDSQLEVLDPAPAAGTGGREVARVTLVDVPSDAPAGRRAPRMVVVTRTP